MIIQISRKLFAGSEDKMKTYANDIIWKQMQKYLPDGNRLTESNLPSEYFIKIGKFQIHIDHYKRLSPEARIILFHGVGGNGRLLSFISVPLHRAGYEIISMDLPLYGYTRFSGKVDYRDWVDVGCGIVGHFSKGNVPVFVFGLSAGGMLAYQVACKCAAVKGIIATCLLDQRNRAITKATAVNPVMGTVGVLAANLFSKPFGGMKLPMKMVANMADISNNADVANLLMSDKKSSGASVSLSFLRGMLNPEIDIEPESFSNIPFLLVHPADDRWTDVALSRLFFDRLACEKRLSMLPGAGHFPLEPLGLSCLEKECHDFINTVLGISCAQL
jgi:alpha-beta hydrolase superfamily lysophospholipase